MLPEEIAEHLRYVVLKLIDEEMTSPRTF